MPAKRYVEEVLSDMLSKMKRPVIDRALFFQLC